MRIGNKEIGANAPPFVVAEMSGNHNGSLESALRLISEAKASGADAVKLQTYRADTITINSGRDEFMIKDGLWKGRTLYELYDWAHTPWEWHRQLFNYANELGVILFSSPFDATAVDLLEDLNAPAYKIASFELVDLPLIRYAASTKKPLIMSTGMANEEEIAEAVEIAREAGNQSIALLHCVSGYPAKSSDYNLNIIPDIIKRYGVVTGLSDHTLDDVTAIVSVALGARIIEKHFTLDRSGNGPDDAFSIEPAELRALCDGVRSAWEALGVVDYGLKSSEKGNVMYRRSLYFVKDLCAGDVITADSVRSIRPGFGVSPKYLDRIVGMTVLVDCPAGNPVTPNVLSSVL
ncbi:pseudaminic acid synthase [Laribacter hongkongensis]|uniref:pseudaminic acid synthase n=1 Tax=Laribacter hongkongensis TaxID=168471 RepID=UPI001EFD2523|nr:pseudaminic acid synthase [Laribacter hongkongensis]MCG9101356.1 pseudaminic acid synthase [Laribacter hongkongensis]MCG9104082.1 pseudaminic acid synthase [Laribacter hongkongensis]MCG9113442.1 pseudaminic acid synthase [Laribacter hongkongensis]MCG9118918.1 pseudaminic acid synthase [Laribacter hongkongensis]